MDNFEKYWMMILVGNVLPKSFLLLHVIFLIKADKCDSRCMPGSAVGVINLSLKVHRHFHQNSVKGIERN